MFAVLVDVALALCFWGLTKGDHLKSPDMQAMIPGNPLETGSPKMLLNVSPIV